MKNILKAFTRSNRGTNIRKTSVQNIVTNLFTSKKLAFTLAEVLITLGIIGVISALIIPMLIQNYQKKQIVIRLKKAYSTTAQAVQLSEVQNGDMEDWDYWLSAKDFYNTYLKNTLKSAEEVNLSSVKKRITYRFLNGTYALDGSAGAIGSDISYIAKLPDGTFILIDAYIYPSNMKYKNIIFDINGFDKPNQIGKDVFYFRICPHKLEPSGNSSTAPDVWENCSKYQSGYGCSKKIMNDGWQIKDDYPW